MLAGAAAGASSGACAPHYEVFVELRGLRDLSEGQRYKVRGTRALLRGRPPQAGR